MQVPRIKHSFTSIVLAATLAAVSPTILRLYGPLEPWFDKTWRPGDIEPQP